MQLFINGKQVRPDGQYSMTIYSPDGQVVGQVADGNRKDIRDAVEAARACTTWWGKRTSYNRGQIMYYIAENLDARREEFAERIQIQTGRSIESCRDEVRVSIERLFAYAAYADKYGGSIQETPIYGVTMQIREPIGVMAIVCPDEFPLLGFVSLFAPAICRGNCIVIVPSEKSPLCATDLYQVFETSDLPGGVVNIVTGCRDHLANLMAEHQNVHMFWYHGPAWEGSYFVEYLSALNCKRTWCSYGMPRDWMSRQEGEGPEFLHEAIDYKVRDPCLLVLSMAAFVFCARGGADRCCARSLQNIWIPYGE